MTDRPARPYGENRNKPPISVEHAKLQRDGDAAYRSICPVCSYGMLPVRRDPKTLTILKEDECLFCLQRVVYIDLVP